MVKKVSSITNIEDHVRLQLYEGAIPLWEAAQARFDYLHGSRVEYLQFENQRLHEQLEDYNRARWNLPPATKWKEETLTGITDVAGDQKLIGMETKAPHLRLITGGGEPPEENWLKKLKPGEMFFVRETKDTTTPIAQCFEFCHEVGDTVAKVVQYYPDGREAELYVISLQFSRMYTLVDKY